MQLNGSQIFVEVLCEQGVDTIFGWRKLGDEDKGYNPGYSFHGRMLALAQVEGMMAVVQDEINN